MGTQLRVPLASGPPPPPLAQVHLPFSPCQSAQMVLVIAHTPQALPSIVRGVGIPLQVLTASRGILMEIAVGSIACPEIEGMFVPSALEPFPRYTLCIVAEDAAWCGSLSNLVLETSLMSTSLALKSAFELTASQGPRQVGGLHPLPPWHLQKVCFLVIEGTESESPLVPGSLQSAFHTSPESIHSVCVNPLPELSFRIFQALSHGAETRPL